MWISIALTGILGVPFVLLWWRLADQWADSEHKRFKVSKDTRERVVIKNVSATGPQDPKTETPETAPRA
jgi:hypothetical protein